MLLRDRDEADGRAQVASAATAELRKQAAGLQSQLRASAAELKDAIAARDQVREILKG